MTERSELGILGRKITSHAALSRELGLARDPELGTPSDPVYKKALTLLEGNGWEVLEIQILRNSPEQRFYVGVKPEGPPYWKHTSVELKEALSQEDARKLGIEGVHTFDSEKLKSGDFKIIADVIKILEQQGYFEIELKRVFAEYTFGLEMFLEIIKRVQEQLPQFSIVDNRFDETGEIYFIFPNQKRAFQRVIRVSPHTNTISTLVIEAKMAKNDPAKVDTKTFKFPGRSTSSKFEQGNKTVALEALNQSIEKAKVYLQEQKII